MAICIGVPATTDHNLRNLNNSRQGVTQLSFHGGDKESPSYDPITAPVSGVEGGGGEPEPDVAPQHGGHFCPSFWLKHNRTPPGMDGVRVTGADTDSTQKQARNGSSTTPGDACYTDFKA